MNEIFIITFLYGIIFKIYDDIIDNKLQINKYIIDFFCYLTVSFITLICYKSPSFSIIWTQMAITGAILDNCYTYQFKTDTEESKDLTSMNDNVWKYTLFISFIFMIYHIIKGKFNFSLNNPKKYTFLLFFIINFFIVIIDIYFTPEHSSNKKYYGRLVVFILILFTVIGMIKKNNYFYDGTIGIMLMNLGFLTCSLLYLSFENYDFIQNLKPKQKKEKPILKKKKKQNKKLDKIY